LDSYSDFFLQALVASFDSAVPFLFLFGASCFAAGEKFLLGILVPTCTHHYQRTQDFSAQDLLQPVIVPAYGFLTVLFRFTCRAIVRLAIALHSLAASHCATEYLAHTP
jgi:hypothetical protein